MNNKEKKLYAKILLPVSLSQMLSYAIPENMEIIQGDIVEVYLGKRRIIGIVWKVIGEEEINFDLKKVKPILRKSNISKISNELCELIIKIASYTMNRTSNVLKMLLSVPNILEDLPQNKVIVIPKELPKFRNTSAREAVFSFLQNVGQAKSKEIVENTKISMSVIKQMVRQNLLEEKIIENTTIFNCSSSFKTGPIDLSTKSNQQKDAIEHIFKKIENPGYSCTVIDGVTGSGKTEVYCTIIDEKIRKTESIQVLVMMPEIILSERFSQYFEERFQIKIIKWNSSVSLSKKSVYWREILSGEPCIVIGTRSALFLPFQNLSLIVVDEEHDNSYKQEDSTVYHARDMSVYYASLLKIPLLLVSATPSFETVHNIFLGKYDVVKLPSRYGKAVLPDIKVIDMRKYARKKEWISPIIRKALVENFNNKKQSLLFLNRKGYAPLTLCGACGYRFMCKDCSCTIVQHRLQNILLCHYCGYKKEIPNTCPECEKENSLIACGPGLDRILEEVSLFMPEAKILKLDSDSISNLGIENFDDILEGKFNIIIGTQIIAKGHHFPNLTLVGILDADSGLAGGDFRAPERCYQLLEQVSGRAGREKDKGYVYIQSFMPNNDIINSLANRDRDRFIALEMESRNIGNMPPFIKLVSLVISSLNEELLIDFIRYMSKLSPSAPKIEVLGPVSSPLYILRKRYRYRFLIKAKKNISVQKYLRKWLSLIEVPTGIKLKIDIDPYSFL